MKGWNKAKHEPMKGGNKATPSPALFTSTKLTIIVKNTLEILVAATHSSSWLLSANREPFGQEEELTFSLLKNCNLDHIQLFVSLTND